MGESSSDSGSDQPAATATDDMPGPSTAAAAYDSSDSDSELSDSSTDSDSDDDAIVTTPKHIAPALSPEATLQDKGTSHQPTPADTACNAREAGGISDHASSVTVTEFTTAHNLDEVALSDTTAPNKNAHNSAEVAEKAASSNATVTPTVTAPTEVSQLCGYSAAFNPQISYQREKIL